MMKSFPVVAVVEDDPEDRLRLRRAFDVCRQDLRIEFFTTGGELLGYLKEGSAQECAADLVLISLHLAEKGAFSLLGEIKADPLLRPIPILMLDGPPDDPEISQCYDMGANTVISRPVQPEELVRMLTTMCDYWFGPVKM